MRRWIAEFGPVWTIGDVIYFLPLPALVLWAQHMPQHLWGECTSDGEDPEVAQDYILNALGSKIRLSELLHLEYNDWERPERALLLAEMADNAYLLRLAEDDDVYMACAAGPTAVLLHSLKYKPGILLPHMDRAERPVTRVVYSLQERLTDQQVRAISVALAGEPVFSPIIWTFEEPALYT